MRGFLRELLPRRPPPGGLGPTALDDPTGRAERDNCDGATMTAPVGSERDAEQQKIGSRPGASAARMEHVGETTPSTDGTEGSRAASLGVSNELSPVKRMIPGVRFRCVRFLNKGANGFVVLAEDRSLVVVRDVTQDVAGDVAHDVVGDPPPESSGDQNVRTSTTAYRALKFLELLWTPRMAKYVEREIINHFKLRHPHVIRLEEIFVTDTHLALVLEYADGGDLFRYVKQRGTLSESTARWFFQQIILALDYCHQMGVVNRDIKLENMLLFSNELPHALPILKLSDFGFSKDTSCQSPPATRLGTPMYIAPEVLANRRGASYDGRKCDIWSVGVVLHVMLTGQYPFLAKQFDSTDVKSFEGQNEMMARIRDQDYRSIPWLSQECNQLLEGLLDFDPATRLTAKGVMETPWFQMGMGSSLVDYNTGIVSDQMRAPRVTPETVERVKDLLSGVVE